MSVDNNDLAPWITRLPATIDLIGVDQRTTNQDQAALNKITPRDIVQAQQDDPVIAPALRSKLQGAKPSMTEIANASPDCVISNLMRDWEKLYISQRNNINYYIRNYIVK